MDCVLCVKVNARCIEVLKVRVLVVGTDLSCKHVSFLHFTSILSCTIHNFVSRVLVTDDG
jgi:hypothetical protein